MAQLARRGKAASRDACIKSLGLGFHFSSTVRELTAMDKPEKIGNHPLPHHSPKNREKHRKITQLPPPPQKCHFVYFSVAFPLFLGVVAHPEERKKKKRTRSQKAILGATTEIPGHSRSNSRNCPQDLTHARIFLEQLASGPRELQSAQRVRPEVRKESKKSPRLRFWTLFRTPTDYSFLRGTTQGGVIFPGNYAY